jgi:TonB family protein
VNFFINLQIKFNIYSKYLLLYLEKLLLLSIYKITKMNTLSIPNPCQEKWEKMQETPLGRFCTSCEKEVIDFTQMSDNEIKEYFIKQADKRVCGRLKNSQLVPHPTLEPFIIYANQPKKAISKIPLYLLATSVLTLSACEKEPFVHKQEITHKLNQTHQNQMDSLKTCSKSDSLKEKGASDISIVGEESEISTVGAVYSEAFFVSKHAEFEGGMSNLYQNYLKKHLKYPQWEKENGIQGKVFAMFEIDKNGKIKNISILRSVEGSKNFDKEVIRVLENMPNWIPAERNGEKVESRMALPFEFKL